jgi:hypothetical protein
MKGGAIMADIKNSLKNIQSKDSLKSTVHTLGRNISNTNREAHNIYEGISKNKKIKMNHKTFN